MAPPRMSLSKLRSPFALSWLVWLAVAVLGLLAAASLVRGMQNALSLTETARSLDLVSYWLGGRILLQGGDPYQAALAGSLWDHLPAGIEAVEREFEAVPANAPLQMILFAPLMGASWEFVRGAFAGLNLVLILLVPGLLLHMLKNRFPLRERLLLAVLFWAMLPTRNAISNGQTSILVLFAALLAVHWARERPLLSGAMLALALMKFTLTLPLLGMFAVLGFWLPLAMALSLHLVSLLPLAALVRAPVTEPLLSYVAMLRTHTGFIGETDLVSLFNRLGLSAALASVLVAGVIFLTCVVLFLTWIEQWDRAGGRAVLQRVLGLPLAAMLLACSTLIVYHRGHDAVVLITLLPAVWTLRRVTLGGRAGTLARPALLWASLPALAIYLLPRSSLASIWPAWEHLLIVASALAALLAWLVSVGVMLLHLRVEPSSPLTVADRSRI